MVGLLLLLLSVQGRTAVLLPVCGIVDRNPAIPTLEFMRYCKGWAQQRGRRR